MSAGRLIKAPAKRALACLDRCLRLRERAMRHPPTRRWLNRKYNRAGGGSDFEYDFNRLFGQEAFNQFFVSDHRPAAPGRKPKLKKPIHFIWEVPFGGRVLKMPVDSNLPLSWCAARLWGSRSNQTFRRFYELVLELRPEGAFLDLGANFGTHSFPFALHGYRVAGFEPQKQCTHYMALLARLNHLDNLSPVRCVVGDHNRSAVDFYESEIPFVSSMLHSEAAKFDRPVRRTRVPCYKVDTYCRHFDIHPTFMKIDVEGYELQALRGARKTITKYRPDIAIEIFPDSPFRKHIYDQFMMWGYRLFVIPADQSKPITPVQTYSTYASSREPDWLMLHSEALANALTDAPLKAAA